MKTKFISLHAFFLNKGRAWVAVLSLMLLSTFAMSQNTVPFTFVNNSAGAYTDANIYVAIVGIQGSNHVWIDCKTGAVKLMQTSDNTVQGPVLNGDQGPGGNGKYANCFAKLSEIPNKIVNIPGIAGCRILMSFNSQLYLYFFGPTGGYGAPNLANPNDPNQGIRYEIVELTNGSNGMWSNTTRVDSYQYPMGLEVWGASSFYKKMGELMTHSQIISQWQSTSPAAFAGCLDASKQIIKFPSKTTAFQTGGAQANYFATYINNIWSKYATGDLVFSAGTAGTWKGRTSGNVFTFTRTSDGQVATISNKPTNTEVMEGSGTMASGGQWDLVVQAQICAAINRHAIDLNLATGATQDFSTPSKFYLTDPYNWYCKFWHRSDISLNALTYSFCYDDVFDQSSTINCPSPTSAKITIGGFAGTTTPPPTGNAIFYKDCNYTGTAVGLNVGTYTMSQLNAAGILNDDISSVKVTSGYKVTLFWDDNFSGTTKVLTADMACDATWNDKTTSVKIESNTAAFSSKIEAETYTAMAGVQLETTTDAGGGQDVGWIDAGDWMAYNITIPTAGTYRVIYRVATPNANMTLRLEKDAGATQLGTVTVPNTGGWQTWSTVAHNVTLPAGTYSVAIATATGGFNLNYFTITNNLSARTVEDVVTTNNDSKIYLSQNPVDSELMLGGTENPKRVEVYNMQGQRVISVENPGNKIDVQSLSHGVHIAVVHTESNGIAKLKFHKK